MEQLGRQRAATSRRLDGRHSVSCRRCRQRIPEDARFCPHCGLAREPPEVRGSARSTDAGSVTTSAAEGHWAHAALRVAIVLALAGALGLAGWLLLRSRPETASSVDRHQDDAAPARAAARTSPTREARVPAPAELLERAAGGDGSAVAELQSWAQVRLKDDPDDVESLRVLGMLEAMSGRPASAAAHFEAAVAATEARPPVALVASNLGELLNDAAAAHAAAGDTERARVLLSRVLQRYPRHAPALCNRAVLLAGEARWQEAEADLRRALELQPRLVPALCALAACRVRSGDRAAARELLVVALSEEPGNAAALALREIAERSGDVDARR